MGSESIENQSTLTPLIAFDRCDSSNGRRVKTVLGRSPTRPTSALRSWPPPARACAILDSPDGNGRIGHKLASPSRPRFRATVEALQRGRSTSHEELVLRRPRAAHPGCGSRSLSVGSAREVGWHGNDDPVRATSEAAPARRGDVARRLALKCDLRGYPLIKIGQTRSAGYGVRP